MLDKRFSVASTSVDGVRRHHALGIACGIIVLGAGMLDACGTEPSPSALRPSVVSSPLQETTATPINESSRLARAAECVQIENMVRDVRALQTLHRPFGETELETARSIYGRTNAGIDALSLMVNPDVGSALEPDVAIGLTTLVSVASQISAATIEVNPTIKPTTAPSPVMALVDLPSVLPVLIDLGRTLRCAT
jgi:hypothetical protein